MVSRHRWGTKDGELGERVDWDGHSDVILGRGELTYNSGLEPSLRKYRVGPSRRVIYNDA